jgi:hypothetical protein
MLLLRCGVVLSLSQISAIFKGVTLYKVIHPKFLLLLQVKAFLKYEEDPLHCRCTGS